MKQFSFVVFSLFLLSSCASKNVEKEVEDEVAHTHVSDPKALGGTIHELIENSKSFSPELKKQLRDILNANRERAEKLSQQSYKYRAVLIQELLAGKVDQEKIKVLKKDIKSVEHLRLKNTFDTVEKISALVSDHPDRHELAKHLLQDRALR